MRSIKNFIRGAGFAFRGIGIFYQTPQLWKYSAVPLFLITLTYAVLLWAGYYLLGCLSDFFTEKCADLPVFLQWLATAASGLSAVVLILIFSVIAVVSIGTLYELFGGLFFDALIKKYATQACPEKLVNADWKFNLKAVWDSMLYSIVTFLLILAAALLNIFLPVIGQIIGIILISCRFGVAYLAMCGFHCCKTMQQTKMLTSRNFMLTLGYGTSIYLIFLFPLAVIFALPGIILGGVLIYNEISSAD